ncbi:cytochrome c oxidase assembly protein COX15 homolog [Bolinopsis microptera]|uniref:cytochrome c oxidase assembly protein COX15 homolog n=1 Tax=Bolinopsis microptera TaxID=2820187 RepID=UPI00307B0437
MMLSCAGGIRVANQTVYSICRRQLYSSSKPKLSPKTLTQYFTKHNIVSLATTPGRFYNSLTIDQKSRLVGYWLLGCCGLVATTVSVGGVTRLTESGLSMTDWKFAGRRAPRNAEEWNVEFDKYKASPQWKYDVVNSGMTLREFKFIWYMEWGHRHLGRVIGTCVVFPTLALLTRPWISTNLKLRLVGFSGLVTFQGFLGWYMVKSGLEDHPESTDIPRVSQYRLASHLGSAFLLYLSMFKTSMEILLPVEHSMSPALQALRRWSGGVAGLAFLTAISGAFVAGLDAGLVYNSYPKFADRWIPTDLIVFTPAWKNFFENTTTVQFDHRFLGHSLLLGICAVWIMSRPLVLPSRAGIAVHALMGMGWVQVGLGVSTLLLHVPTWLAATHQQGSLVLLTLAAWLHHELGKKRIKLFKKS